MKQYVKRILAAALGVYLALSLSQTATELMKENRRRDELERSCRTVRAEILELQRQRAMTDRQVRQWAFREKGLTGPDDVVFFDGGAWK